MADRSYKKVLTLRSTVTTDDTVTVAEVTTILSASVTKDRGNVGTSASMLKSSFAGNVITITELNLVDEDVTIVIVGG